MGSSLSVVLPIKPIKVGYAIGYPISHYSGKSFDTSAQSSDSRGIGFKPDGTKMYVLSRGDSVLYQYSIVKIKDVSSAVYDSVSLDLGIVTSSPRALTFKPDGTRLYITSADNDRVFQYALTDPWEIDSAEYENNWSISGGVSTPAGLAFKPDGSRMYIGGFNSNKIYQYELSTAWDVDTAEYDSINFEVMNEESLLDIAIKPDGKKLYVIGSENNIIYQYNLPSAWDVNVAVYEEINFAVTNECTQAESIRFGLDGEFFYTIDRQTNIVYQYNTSFNRAG